MSAISSELPELVERRAATSSALRPSPDGDGIDHRRVKAERVTRQQLGKFLLRHGRLYEEGKSTWTKAHFEWIRAQTFEAVAHQKVLVDYLKAVEDTTERVARLTKDITELVETWSLKPLVKALQSMRGIQLITAVIIASELGDLKRFKSAPELMAFLGLVPSEHSSGESKKRGRIARTGNGHVRRVLVESAWSYRFRPSMSVAIRKRNEGVSDNVKSSARLGKPQTRRTPLPEATTPDSAPSTPPRRRCHLRAMTHVRPTSQLANGPGEAKGPAVTQTSHSTAAAPKARPDSNASLVRALARRPPAPTGYPAPAGACSR